MRISLQNESGWNYKLIPALILTSAAIACITPGRIYILQAIAADVKTRAGIVPDDNYTLHL